MTALLVIALCACFGACLPLLRRVAPVGVAEVLLGQAAPPLEGQVQEVQRLRKQVLLARLPVVERAAQEATGGSPGAGELRVVLVADRAVLRFSFEHPDEQAARRGALAAVRAYDELRINERRQRALLDLGRTDAALRASAVGAAVQDDELRKALAERRARLLVLRDSTEGLTILDLEVRRPFSTTPVRGGLAGAVAGLFPAVLLAHRAARRGRRLGGPEAAVAVLDAPTLAVLEHFRPGRSASPDSQLGGGYSVAAEGLMLLLGVQTSPTVAVVGVGHADGWVSSVTADLALGLVRCGHAVCVIGTGTGGALDLLAAAAPPAAREHAAARLSLVQAAPGEPWPDLRGHDVVLIDAPDVGTRAAALAATARAGSAIVVLDNRVTREELQAVQDRLARIGIHAVGHLQVQRRRLTSVLRAAVVRRRRRRLVSSPLLAST